jgi:hypothetical protein
MATTQNAPSEELAVRSSADLSTLDELRRIILENVPVEDVVEDDPDAISQEIVAQLLNAASDDELESVGSATGWRTLLNVPMRIHGFRWRPSAYFGKSEDGGGASVFFVVQATRLDTGERVVLTTGSRNALAQLCNLAQRQQLVDSIWMMVEATKATGRGFKPIWLVRPPEVAAAARAAVEAAPASE